MLSDQIEMVLVLVKSSMNPVKPLVLLLRPDEGRNFKHERKVEQMVPIEI